MMNLHIPTIDPVALGKVAVLMGGTSAERDISLMSGNGVLAALKSVGVDAHAFDPAERSLDDLRAEGFARCFIALHGPGGEDGAVQQELERLQLPYTGAGVTASRQAMDKDATKVRLREQGIATPAWDMVASIVACEAAFDAIGAPMIVKPVREGSSIGLTKVMERSQCAQAYVAASKNDAQVLCEAFVAGEETTCPVLEINGQAVALPVVRIAAPQGNYDYQNKYFNDTTTYHCPSGLSPQEERHIQDLAVASYQAVNCRGWGRVDVMINAADRQPYVLEINTAPGMTSHSLAPMSAKVAGLSYEQLCVYLLSIARLDATSAQANQ